jgi:hypothetical protein
MKKNIIFLSFFSLIIVCGIFYLPTEFLSKDKARDLEIITVEKAKSAIKAIIPYINKSIESSDDINLLTNIESIVKTENITTCFILDKNSKVIIHNNTIEWNTEKNSETYNNAVKQKTELLQQTFDKDLLLFSKPLIKDYTLFCILSIQKAKETARYWKIKYYTAAFFSAVLIVIPLYFLAKLLILMPFNRIKKTLEHKSTEDIKEDEYNEITDIFLTEREKIAKKIKILEEDRESLIKIVEYLQKASIKESSAFIILNSFNGVVFAYDATGNILKKDFEKDSHILEISKKPELVKIVVKANENPDKEINEIFENYKVAAISINTNGKIDGTIINIKN